MKFIKLFAGFLIFYFVVVAVSSFMQLAKWVSFGNVYLEYGFYVFMVILFHNYMVRPWLGYMGKPSLETYRALFNGDEVQAKKIKKYLMRKLEPSRVALLKDLEDLQSIQVWVKGYLEETTKEFGKITQSYAFKVSSAVLFSPNSFLDGITILYGNASMVYSLSKKVQARYTFKDLWQMYFSLMSVASISGIVEEYDDFLIGMLEELLEDLSERMGEEAGKAITDAIPIVNVAAKSTSFLIQSAGNYAFIIYNGRRFKKRIQNTYAEVQLTENEMNTESRREARRERMTYVKDLSNGFSKKAKSRRFFGKGKKKED